MSNGFIYIRNAEDDAYVNHGNNFRGMEQASSGVVNMYFESPITSSVGANAYDKITLAVTANSEKQAMIDINGALFGGKESIRDFIAFPKNTSGRDVMIDSPSKIDSSQLKELGL